MDPEEGRADMNTERRGFSELFRSPRRRKIISAILTLLLYALVWILQDRITFFDVDDRNVAWALAGYRGGSPSFAHPFLNPVTAWAVSGLYLVFPKVPWWYTVQTACILLAAWTAGVSILDTAQRRRIPAVIPILLLTVMDAACFYYALTLVTFTLTSALLAAAACMRLLSARSKGETLWSLILLAAAFLIRQSSGLVGLCYYFGCLAVCGVRERGRRGGGFGSWKRFLIRAVAAFLIAAVLTGANMLGRAFQHPQGFLEFEDARAAFMDYPHDSFAENPGLYESVGWDENLYALTSAWFYMDARINAETLSAIHRGSSAESQDVQEHVLNALEVIRAFYGKYPIGEILTGITVLLFLLILIGYGGVFRKLGAVALLLGGTVLLGYLGLQGRVNLRALMSLVFPCLGCLLILTEESFSGRRGHGFFSILAGMILGLALAGSYRIFRTVISYRAEEMLDRSNAVADYVLDHPDSLYIRDVYTGIDWNALRVYPDQKPVNLMDWGDCDTGTRARLDQWKANGFDAPREADVFLEPGVYYLCTEGEPYLDRMNEYMIRTWNASGYRIEDRIRDDILVVRFFNGDMLEDSETP